MALALALALALAMAMAMAMAPQRWWARNSRRECNQPQLSLLRMNSRVTVRTVP
jgi:hypothetical protein